jgi:hypothetical protein
MRSLRKCSTFLIGLSLRHLSIAERDGSITWMSTRNMESGLYRRISQFLDTFVSKASGGQRWCLFLNRLAHNTWLRIGITHSSVKIDPVKNKKKMRWPKKYINKYLKTFKMNSELSLLLLLWKMRVQWINKKWSRR